MGPCEPPAARLRAMTTHGPRSARTRTTALGRGISAVRRETLLFPLAIGVIAMDVIDDHYLQPGSEPAACTASVECRLVPELDREVRGFSIVGGRPGHAGERADRGSRPRGRPRRARPSAGARRAVLGRGRRGPRSGGHAARARVSAASGTAASGAVPARRRLRHRPRRLRRASAGAGAGQRLPDRVARVPTRPGAPVSGRGGRRARRRTVAQRRGACARRDRRAPAVAGDSSGGNLAASVTHTLARDGAPPSFQLLIYPMLDATASSASYDEFARAMASRARSRAGTSTSTCRPASTGARRGCRRSSTATSATFPPR